MNRVKKIGERLKQERKRLNLSQVEAGRAVGVSHVMWGRYERGAVMGVDVESKLQGAGFDVDYIFTGFTALQVLKETLAGCCMTLEPSAKPRNRPDQTFVIDFNGKPYQVNTSKIIVGETNDPDRMEKPYIIDIDIYVGDMRVSAWLQFAYGDFRDEIFTRIDADMVQRLVNDTYIAENINSALED